MLTFSSMKFKQPSLGTKAAIFFPFLISCTRAHLRMAELGCLASIPLRSSKKVFKQQELNSNDCDIIKQQVLQREHERT